jgi:biopolymer transport protein ExbD
MGKRDRGSSVNLDSFLDIMTCMLGILVLMIILTGIDASQIKVLVPTPIEKVSDKRPVFIECRNNELFLISVQEITKLANERFKALAEAYKDDQAGFVANLETNVVRLDAYEVDLSFALIGQYALRPLPDVKGYHIRDAAKETASDWFGKLLGAVNKDEEVLTFLVRDDSFEVFKKARALAWLQSLDASCELMDIAEPLRFGLGGARTYAQ